MEKVFSKEVLHGRQFSLTRAPSAFKTCFGWVLNSEANGESQQLSTHICCVALDSDSKEVYKPPVGKRVHWQKKKGKKLRFCLVEYWHMDAPFPIFPVIVN